MKIVKYLYITPLLLGTLVACDDTFEEKPNNEWNRNISGVCLILHRAF